jgi:hypothetical protein
MIRLLIVMKDEANAAAVRKLTGRVAGIQVVSPPLSDAQLEDALQRVRGHRIDSVVYERGVELDVIGFGHWKCLKSYIDECQVGE